MVFVGPPGTLKSCPVCDWRDDAAQLEFATTLAEGANGLTLFEAQRSGAPPAPGVERDEEWRPIDMAVDEFEDVHEPDARRAPPGDATVLYYWRPTYWRLAK